MEFHSNLQRCSSPKKTKQEQNMSLKFCRNKRLFLGTKTFTSHQEGL